VPKKTFKITHGIDGTIGGVSGIQAAMKKETRARIVSTARAFQKIFWLFHFTDVWIPDSLSLTHGCRVSKLKRFLYE